MTKVNRLISITELIRDYPVSTQEELLSKLHDIGYHVTQATVSRDIRELRLSKVTDNNGTTRYTLPSMSETENEDKFRTIFREAVITVATAGNIVVIKCYTGMGNAACAALDWMDMEHIVGTIAGDDTIFCAMDSADSAQDLVVTLTKLIS